MSKDQSGPDDVPFITSSFMPCVVVDESIEVDPSKSYLHIPDYKTVSGAIWTGLLEASREYSIVPLGTSVNKIYPGVATITFTWVKCNVLLEEFDPYTNDLSDACSLLSDDEIINNIGIQKVIDRFQRQQPLRIDIYRSLQVEIPREIYETWEAHI